MTPEMQRFNEAVERADTLLGNGSDLLDADALLTALWRARWHNLHQWVSAIHELEDAAQAIYPSKTDGE